MFSSLQTIHYLIYNTKLSNSEAPQSSKQQINKMVYQHDFRAGISELAYASARESPNSRIGDGYFQTSIQLRNCVNFMKSVENFEDLFVPTSRYHISVAFTDTAADHIIKGDELISHSGGRASAYFVWTLTYIKDVGTKELREKMERFESKNHKNCSFLN